MTSRTGWACGAVAAALALVSSPAGAHGIAIDANAPMNWTANACSNGDPNCQPLSTYLNGGSGDYAGVFDNIYIYNDGLITVGSPQGTGAPVELFPGYSPSLAGAAVYLTANAFPPGAAPSDSYPNIVDLRVTYVVGNSIFAVQMSGNVPDQNNNIPQSFLFDYAYGAYSGTWANETSTPFIDGTLPKYVTIGWSGAYAIDASFDTASAQSYTAFVTPTDNYDPTQDPNLNLNDEFVLGKVVLGDNGLQQVTPAVPGVPEPATWALTIVGFGLTGAALRRRRLAAG